MNICMLVYSHFSRDARVRRYAESLSRRNHNVDVICLREDYKPKQKNIRLIHYPIRRQRLGQLWYIVEYFLFFIYSFITLTSNFLIRRYKLIHVHNMPDILVFASLLPKIFGSKIILDLHDPMPELYLSKYKVKKTRLVVKCLTFLEKLSISFSDFVITANSEFKKIFLSRNSFCKNKIQIVLNCPDTLIFKKKKNSRTGENFTLIYMGTIEERFDLDVVVKAVGQLIKHIPNLRFIIIPKIKNEGAYFASLKKIAESNPALTKAITILDPMPLEQISTQLQKADIGIVLSKNEVFTQNIFPVKLLEFVQMNVPVIATKTKMLTKNFSNNMLFFLKDNKQSEFTNAVLKLYENKKLRRKLVANAKKYLLKNNWKKEEIKYQKIITSLLK